MSVSVTVTTPAPQQPPKTAAEYVKALQLDALDDDDDEEGGDDEGRVAAMTEEVADEMHKAGAAWGQVLPSSSPGVWLSDATCAETLCALVEALGTTYDERRHGGALRRQAGAGTGRGTGRGAGTGTGTRGGDGCLTEGLFVDWYVRMLYAEDDEDRKTRLNSSH